MLPPFYVFSLTLLLFLNCNVALVTIVGGTGTIGLKVVEVFRKYPRLVTYRHGKEQLVSRWLQSSQSNAKEHIKCIKLDLREPDDSGLSTSPLWSQSLPDEQNILINVAGVCLSGSSADAMHVSMAVNAIKPIALAKAAMQAHERLTVINVSSGEGELAFLNSDVVQDLNKICSSVELDQYVSLLQHTYNPASEYAHGPTPMYSLSKAILNKSTQLLHKENGGTTGCNVRILACCPGNVASPMSAEEELEDTVTAEYAADHIFKYATEPEKYPGGRFYRHGEEIAW